MAAEESSGCSSEEMEGDTALGLPPLCDSMPGLGEHGPRVFLVRLDRDLLAEHETAYFDIFDRDIKEVGCQTEVSTEPYLRRPPPRFLHTITATFFSIQSL